MGLFDQSVDDDGVNLAPVPALDPSVLPPGLLQGMVPPMGPQMPRPMMPQVPQAPPPPGPMQHILSAALLGLAAGLGPSHGGTGAIAGLRQAQDANADARQQEFHNRQTQFKEQQAEAIRQQQMFDTEQAAQQKAQAALMLRRQTMLESIAKTIPTLTTKDEYDRFVDFAGNKAVLDGFRDLNPNALRANFKFMAPSQKQRAQAAAKAFFENDLNKAMLKNNPEAAANSVVQFDANDDGVAENIPMRQFLSMAGVSVMTGEDGEALGLAPGTDGPIANLALKAKVAKFRAENGRAPKPGAEMDALVTAARTPPARPKEPGAGNPNDDIKEITAGIVDGTQPPDLSRMYGKSAGVRAELHRQGFDLTAAQLDWQATQRWSATANGPAQVRMRQSVDNATHALDIIDSLADQWDAGKFPMLNSARLAAAKTGVLGPEAQKIAAQLSAQIADVTSEFGNVIMGGNSPTDHALQLASQNFGTNWSRQTLKALTQQARQNLRIRANSMRNVGPVVPGAAPPTDVPPPRYTVTEKGKP